MMMDGIVEIGPLAMATDRLMAIAAIWGFVAMASLIAARLDGRANRVGWISLLLGFVGARMGFILANIDAFMADPWTMVAIWQGGFSALTGIIVAAITIAIMLGRKPAGLALMATLSGLALLHAGAVELMRPQPRPMPQLALTTLSGDKIALGTAGRPMVINLWATWCPPCRREMPMFIDVAQGSNIPVLLVNQGESAAAIRAYLNQQGFADKGIVTDVAGILGRTIASPALPTTLFVNEAGDIVDLHAGEISRAALTAAIHDLQRTS